jgi:hypothetical protein
MKLPKVINSCPICKAWYIPITLTPEQYKYLEDFGDVVDLIINNQECDECEQKKR